MSESPEADHARMSLLRQQLADLEAEMRRFAEHQRYKAPTQYTELGKQVLAWAETLKGLR